MTCTICYKDGTRNAILNVSGIIHKDGRLTIETVEFNEPCVMDDYECVSYIVRETFVIDLLLIDSYRLD